MTQPEHPSDETDPTFEPTGEADSPPVQADVVEDTPRDENELAIRLREAKEEADKRVLLAQAESENFRKRMRRDFDEQLRYAALPMVTDLLQVRDNLWRAIEAADGGSTEGLKEGVAMVAKLFDDTLAKYGVREIPAEGEGFDPNYHEAISQMPSAEVASGMVAHVATPGFQMHERVVRPSQVVVSTGSPEG